MDGVTEEAAAKTRSVIALIQGLSVDHADEIVSGIAREGLALIEKLISDYEAMKREVLSLQELNRRLTGQKDLRQRELERLGDDWTAERRQIADVIATKGVDGLRQIIELIQRPR